MFEPLVGLIVAMLLGAYLVYTLLHPEPQLGLGLRSSARCICQICR